MSIYLVRGAQQAIDLTLIAVRCHIIMNQACYFQIVGRATRQRAFPANAVSFFLSGGHEVICMKASNKFVVVERKVRHSTVTRLA